MRIVSTDPSHPGLFAIGQEAAGVIALGQSALGVIAIGQIARGVLCIGQGAIGVFAVGQGAIGLFHGTGMMALAGQRGFGIVLHTLPRIAQDPLPKMEPATPLVELTTGRREVGWVPAKITPQGLLELEEGEASLDASQVYGRLLEAAKKGLDRAHVKLRGARVPEASGYREARSHVGLRAEEVVVYSSSRPRYVAYGMPPSGNPGGPASLTGIVLRSAAFLVAFTVVLILSFLPLWEVLQQL